MQPPIIWPGDMCSFGASIIMVLGVSNVRFTPPRFWNPKNIPKLRRLEQTSSSFVPRLEERTKVRGDSLVIMTVETCYVPFTVEPSAWEGRLLILR